MKFIQAAKKIENGFRVSPMDRKEISKVCINGTGSLIVDLLDIATGYKLTDLKAIWTSNKIKLISFPDGFNKDSEYVVLVKNIVIRKKGERI